MKFEEDIGKFITISYKKKDGTEKFVRGKLEKIEDDLLVIINIHFPEIIKKVNPNEIIIIDYSAKPVKQNDE